MTELRFSTDGVSERPERRYLHPSCRRLAAIKVIAEGL